MSDTISAALLAADAERRTIADARIRDLERDLTNACALITDITDAIGLTGPHQGMDDEEAPAAVRAAFDSLRDEIAQLRSVEAVAIADARITALTTALRDVLAIVTAIGGYMTHEDQQKIRDARALVMG